MDEAIRVITLTDMDAFYTQVKEREQHHLRGLPLLSIVPFSRGATNTGHLLPLLRALYAGWPGAMRLSVECLSATTVHCAHTKA
ncbi:hypothetical protein niasHT_031912 [Heterodera trifolii]|uniref:UmuC domain-containing protein n=1 Tax=Heterodera trifolii TaxID=157864 RepID=A0ABD2HYA7_9BILA